MKKLLYTILFVSVVLLIILTAFLGLELYKAASSDTVVVKTEEYKPVIISEQDIEETMSLVKPTLKIDSFATNYRNYSRSTLKVLKRFDIILVDPYLIDKEYLKDLKSSGTIVLASIEIGKASKSKVYWDDLDKNIILSPDKSVEGVFLVDIASKQWHSAILDYEIPEIFSLGDIRPGGSAESAADSSSYSGFDGLVIENLDMINEDPNLKQKFYQLIKEIAIRYPGILIFQKGSIDILYMTYPFIDGVFYEERCYAYSEYLDKYMPSSNIKQDEMLMNALKKKPMPVLIMDHVSTDPPNDSAALACYTEAKSLAAGKYNIVWNADSEDHETYMWNFLVVK